MTADLLKSLLLTNRSVLMRFILARGASADEAEDVVQDLYLAISTRSIGAITDPRAYLFRMANNLLLDRRREERRRARRELDAIGPALTGPTPAGGSMAADNAMIAKEELVEVRLALESLPVRTLEIFRRFRLDGERQKRIATDLGISVSAVEKHLQRAYEVVLEARQGLDAEYALGRRLGGKGKSDAN